MQFQQTILVVDNNGSHRLLPGLILRPLGFTVLECASAQAAIDLLPTVKVACVLLGTRMSGLNAADVLRRIRSNPIHEKTKVIAYTAYAGVDDMDRLISEGFDAVLFKPIKSFELIKVIKNL